MITCAKKQEQARLNQDLVLRSNAVNISQPSGVHSSRIYHIPLSTASFTYGSRFCFHPSVRVLFRRDDFHDWALVDVSCG
jgi:hypothetical protein